MGKNKEISKFIAFTLRHHPEVLGVSMDEHGWVRVDEMVAMMQKRQPFCFEDLVHIVKEDSKQRYCFSVDKKYIRANQGHSIAVDVELIKKEPPQFLWHGSATRFAASIEQHGLIAMSRLYVHLSTDIETARLVGKRHGKPIVYCIHARKMFEDGYPFYLAANGVWLTKEVPFHYLEKLECR